MLRYITVWDFCQIYEQSVFFMLSTLEANVNQGHIYLTMSSFFILTIFCLIESKNWLINRKVIVHY